jgi:hypothetical protein
MLEDRGGLMAQLTDSEPIPKRDTACCRSRTIAAAANGTSADPFRASDDVRASSPGLPLAGGGSERLIGTLIKPA